MLNKIISLVPDEQDDLYFLFLNLVGRPLFSVLLNISIIQQDAFIIFTWRERYMNHIYKIICKT